jgi:hypothetical protein
MRNHLTRVPCEPDLPAQGEESFFLAGPPRESRRATNKFRHLALLADIRRQRPRVHSRAA